jgi:hypothetical protein
MLSASATVTLTVERALPGALVTGHCQVRTRENHRHPSCARLVMLPGTIVLAGVPGADAFAFTAAIGGRALGPGSYRLLATPTSDGRAGTQRQAAFRITG